MPLTAALMSLANLCLTSRQKVVMKVPVKIKQDYLDDLAEAIKDTQMGGENPHTKALLRLADIVKSLIEKVIVDSD